MHQMLAPGDLFAAANGPGLPSAHSTHLPGAATVSSSREAGYVVAGGGKKPLAFLIRPWLGEDTLISLSHLPLKPHHVAHEASTSTTTPSPLRDSAAAVQTPVSKPSNVPGLVSIS
jgi:hypothetical protein